jgi:hypothetical protein
MRGSQPLFSQGNFLRNSYATYSLTFRSLGDVAKVVSFKFRLASRQSISVEQKRDAAKKRNLHPTKAPRAEPYAHGSIFEYCR